MKQDAQFFADTIFQKGRKVECFVCGGKYMSQNHNGLMAHGITAHILARHPEHASAIMSADKICRTIEKDRRKAEAARVSAEKAEASARARRKIIVTGAFLDDVIDQINSLIRMMEPYYSQCDGASEAESFISHIEAMQVKAREESK